jgi:hypothetical protein
MNQETQFSRYRAEIVRGSIEVSPERRRPDAATSDRQIKALEYF